MRIAVHEEPAPQERAVCAQNVQHIGAAVARVDLHGQSRPVGELELPHKERLLGGAGGRIPMIVQPDLPDRHAFFLLQEPRDGANVRLGRALRLGGVDARRKVHSVIPRAKVAVHGAVRGRIAREDDHPHPRRADALPFGGDVVALLRKMGVDIEIHISG